MASIYSTSKGFTKAEKIKFTELIKNMYNEFVKLVSEKRQLSIKDAENAAKGRVWTGEDAKKYGLVDELCSLSESINEIKNITGFNTDEEVYIKEFKSKNKFSFSNISKLSHLGIINEYFELLDILKREQIYAVVPHSYKIH
jgi:protease-4